MFMLPKYIPRTVDSIPLFCLQTNIQYKNFKKGSSRRVGEDYLDTNVCTYIYPLNITSNINWLQNEYFYVNHVHLGP